MRTSLAALLACAVLDSACGGARIADRCEVQHGFSGGDTIDARINRIDDGWAVSFQMSVRLSSTDAPIALRGLGRVFGTPGSLQCQIVEAGGAPGSPRFDEALCLDEFETLGDLLSDAEASALPGETIVQEVSLRARRRRRTRSRVATGARSYRERAEITRDAKGRVVRLVRSTAEGGREEITVTYPRDVEGRCLPVPEED